MFKKKCFLLLLLFPFISCAQKEKTGLIEEPQFDQRVSNLLNGTIPFIGVKELNEIKHEVTIFDARELEEYRISHIEGAKYIGYKQFDPKSLEGVDKEKKIVLYCSIGYRSEKIGEKLKKLGYNNVYNLYGSIFEWANQSYPLMDSNDKRTFKLHTYNANWSKWVNNKRIEKVW